MISLARCGSVSRCVLDSLCSQVTNDTLVDGPCWVLCCRASVNNQAPAQSSRCCMVFRCTMPVHACVVLCACGSLPLFWDSVVETVVSAEYGSSTVMLYRNMGGFPPTWAASTVASYSLAGVVYAIDVSTHTQHTRTHVRPLYIYSFPFVKKNLDR